MLLLLGCPALDRDPWMFMGLIEQLLIHFSSRHPLPVYSTRGFRCHVFSRALSVIEVRGQKATNILERARCDVHQLVSRSTSSSSQRKLKNISQQHQKEISAATMDATFHTTTLETPKAIKRNVESAPPHSHAHCMERVQISR